MLHELEGEITYLLIRDRRPKDVIEMSPNTGWSTMWILSALRDNRNGSQLRSYDIHDISTRYVPRSLANGRWKFIQGDCRRTLRDVEQADYLFIDSDHSREFAKWYTNLILTRTKPGTVVSVHDVYHSTDPSEEGKIVFNWLKQSKLSYWTAASNAAPEVTKVIIEQRRVLGFNFMVNRRYGDHSMVFFEVTSSR